MANGIFTPRPIQAQTPDFGSLIQQVLGQQQQERSVQQLLLNQQLAQEQIRQQQLRGQREQELLPLRKREAELGITAAEEDITRQRAEEQRTSAASFLEQGQLIKKQQFQEQSASKIDNLMGLRDNWARTKNPIDEANYYIELIRNIQEASAAGVNLEEAPWLEHLLDQFTEATEEVPTKAADFKEVVDPGTGQVVLKNVLTGEIAGGRQLRRRPVEEAKELIGERGEVQKEVAEVKSELGTQKALTVLRENFKLKADFEQFKQDIEEADFTDEQLNQLHDAAAALLEKDTLSNVQKATVKKNLGILNAKSPEKYSSLINAMAEHEDRSLIEKTKDYLGDWGVTLGLSERKTKLPTFVLSVPMAGIRQTNLPERVKALTPLSSSIIPGGGQ
jgi:hypothetical protein